MRILATGDEAALSAFLAKTPETAMFLRSNLAAAGLADNDQPYAATYVGAFDADTLVGVAAFCWNGNVMLQCATDRAADLAAAALAARPARSCQGVLGPPHAVAEVLRLPAFAARHLRVAARQVLLACDLADLPPPSAHSDRVRPANLKDREALALWRHAYLCETLGAAASPALLAQAQDEIDRAIDAGRLYLLCMGDNALATAAFNATLPEIVQVGGLYCPPEERGLGYGRIALHGALLAAREKGVARAVLFAAEANMGALRSSQALGFKPVADYALAFY
jgi:GNAT superfamily N-acetyltransferase